MPSSLLCYLCYVVFVSFFFVCLVLFHLFLSSNICILAKDRFVNLAYLNRLRGGDGVKIKLLRSQSFFLPHPHRGAYS